MQALAMTDDEKEEDGGEEKEEKRGVRTACCFVSAAYPDTWRTLKKMRHTEGQLLHSVLLFHSFLCLFTHMLPSCVFLSLCVCVLFLVHFLTTPLVPEVHIFRHVYIQV